MATYTNTGGYHGRTFFIGRENGQNDKDGRPYFFEFLPEIPENKERRKFETRTNSEGAQRHYELFQALDGYLVGIDIEVKSFDSTRQNDRWLVLQMVDADDEYKIEVSRIDHRYAMDIMKRLLDPNFTSKERLRLSPYSIKENGRTNMGLSAFSGPDGKLVSSYKSEHLKGMPQPETREWKGETQWNFLPVAEWLFEQIKTNVVPVLMIDPITAPPKPSESNPQPEPVMMDQNFPNDPPPADGDDLPF